ncbi:MAG: hypothetical protein CVT98_01450 [Bacteroidetes bacterium HGW-Bacteroidetes-15]|nr:MAG: hypothetical protein CVT98_01450 [Bacteroidetes bacterium HGW-Bacteroidetes-15]
MKFIEGLYYDFQVIKQVNLVEEGDFFLLRHQSGRRLMLPVEIYKNYGIEPDKTIRCRVDKVSCTGKVYLEPEHPFYKEGNDYPFNLIEIKPKGKVEDAKIVLADVFGNRIICNWDQKHIVSDNKTLTMRVIRVKKGVPQLEFPNTIKETEFENSLIGSRMEFRLQELTINNEADQVFVLASADGHRAQLKLKHYKGYGLEVGDIISCFVYGRSNSGNLKIEPDNPYYKIGEVYMFDIDRFEEVKEASGEEIENIDIVLVVRDFFGNKCGISVDLNHFNLIKNKTRIKSRVTGFRKGKPKLELVI